MEAYGDSRDAGTVMTVAITGLLIVFAIALAGAAYPDGDVAPSTELSATPGVTGH
jgi:hypothetical protein